MNIAKVFVHRVASIQELRALESVGVRAVGVSLVDNPELSDGRALSVEEVTALVSAVDRTLVVVECHPEQAFDLPREAHRGVFLWTPRIASSRMLNRADALGFYVILGPIPVYGYLDVELGTPLPPNTGWEFQIRGGEVGGLGDTLTKPGIFNRIREMAAVGDLFVGFDAGPKTIGLAEIAVNPAAHALVLGHPQTPPAERHHLPLGWLFDTLTGLGFPSLDDAELSRLEAADILRRQRGRLRFAKEEAHAAGKEPFDLERFGRLFDLSSEHTAPTTLPEQVARWEERYYLTARHAMSLAHFADIWREMEAYR